MPLLHLSGQSNTETRKLNMPEPARHQNKADSHLLVRLWAEMMDAGKSMPASVFSMPIPAMHKWHAQGENGSGLE
jgi:hypothetical protein